MSDHPTPIRPNPGDPCTAGVTEAPAWLDRIADWLDELSPGQFALVLVAAAMLRRDTRPTVAIPPRKEEAPCCTSRRDTLGRLPLGFCSPGCIRRPAVWAALQERAR